MTDEERREKKREKKRLYRKRHPEAARRHYAKHREQFLARVRRWRQAHPEYQTEYYQKNRERLVAQMREWRRAQGIQPRQPAKPKAPKAPRLVRLPEKLILATRERARKSYLKRKGTPEYRTQKTVSDHRYRVKQSAAVEFLASLGLLEKGSRETSKQRRQAALAYVRAAGLLDEKQP